MLVSETDKRRLPIQNTKRSQVSTTSYPCPGCCLKPKILWKGESTPIICYDYGGEFNPVGSRAPMKPPN